MKRNRTLSRLSEHTLLRKAGILKSPINEILGDKMAFNSWAKNRLPEYFWLGLILQYYGRNEGLRKAGKILSAGTVEKIFLIIFDSYERSTY